MAIFYIRIMRENSGSRLIGYQVCSRSKSGGERYHFSKEAQHPSSLARALMECETEAARLNAEASANRLRSRR